MSVSRPFCVNKKRLFVPAWVLAMSSLNFVSCARIFSSVILEEEKEDDLEEEELEDDDESDEEDDDHAPVP